MERSFGKRSSFPFILPEDVWNCTTSSPLNISPMSFFRLFSSSPRLSSSSSILHSEAHLNCGVERLQPLYTRVLASSIIYAGNFDY
jgi:hypothetical protein